MLLEAAVAAFVLTQVGYFLLNCGLVGLFVRRPTTVVDERTLGRVLEEAETESAARSRQSSSDGGRGSALGPGPASRSTTPTDRGSGPACRLPERSRCRINVLVPAFGRRWERLEETIASLATQSYPGDRLLVFVVYEGGDPNAARLAAAVESGRASGIEVLPVDVEDSPAALSATQSPDGRAILDDADPRTRAALLARAFETLSFADDELVAVVDAGTTLPVDTLELAVAGLAEYDVVQAKHTVAIGDGGLLPLLESMGSAVRSELWAATASTGPVGLLEEGYVVRARVLADLEQRCGDDRYADGVTIGRGLGVAAFRRGYRLGIVDRYVRRRWPSTIDAWLRRARRQVREPYRTLPAPDWSPFDRLQFVTPAVLTQLLAITNVVGIPSTLLVGLLAAFGAVTVSAPLAVLVGCNLLGWTYYGVRARRTALDAVALEGRLARLRYALVSNPVSHTLYVTLWAVPIALALGDVVRGDASPDRVSRTKRKQPPSDR